MEKELLRLVVVKDEDSLIATVDYDETDDVFGNLAFVFVLFCENMGMTTKEALKYLKISAELWEKYRKDQNG